MTDMPLHFDETVALAGGGVLDAEMLAEARALAPYLVAADGAADRLGELGATPDVVIGDMDSIHHRERLPATTRLLELAEQETTDFEKCLYATEAPLYLGIGFSGRRMDHSLAVLNAMLRHPEKQVVLIGEVEVMAFAQPNTLMRLALHPGASVSFFPLSPVAGTHSEGLVWPIDGLEMAPDGQIGTSNAAQLAEVAFRFDRPGALVMLERCYLSALIAALTDM
ncbi:MAG: thiamine diphosphokinase [Pseudomonadota bacterium]